MERLPGATTDQTSPSPGVLTLRPSFRPVSPRRAALTMMLFCAAGAALANTSAPVTPAEKLLPTEWKPWNGHHYRLEADGHLSCYSENSSKTACSINAPDPAKAQPLRCNDPRWGGQSRKRTGYELAGHWCNTAYANLFAEWKSYQPLGFDKQLATTPRGDVMCKSADGTTCLPANAPATTNVIDPLVCGSIYKKRMGGSSTGYDDPKHWCSSPEIVLHTADVMMEETDDDTNSPILAKRHLPLNGWRLEEEPAWIFRFKAQDSTHYRRLAFRVNSHTPDGPRLFAAAGLRPDDPEHPMSVGNHQYGAFARPVQLDTERRGTLAIHVDASGATKFFQAPGWPNDSLDARFALALKGSYASGLSDPPVQAWPVSVDASDLDISARYFYSSARDLPAGPITEMPTVTEVVMIRKRREPSR